MFAANPEPEQWTVVDEGWGRRRAADFSTLSEPRNCLEYVSVHHMLGVDAGDRALDVACGSGLAVELARLRGATCAGIDASVRLVAVARLRNPDSDIRVGDMHQLPWRDGDFDVVTSFRGVWGTTPTVVLEMYRCGGTSRSPPGHGRWPHSGWPPRTRSITRRPWCRWAGPVPANASSNPQA